MADWLSALIEEDKKKRPSDELTRGRIQQPQYGKKFRMIKAKSQRAVTIPRKTIRFKGAISSSIKQGVSGSQQIVKPVSSVVASIKERLQKKKSVYAKPASPIRLPFRKKGIYQ